MITSPYNFVPLSDKVVMPFWAKHVSHDIPFKDAQSGVLKLTITAESPIYVRNGVPRSVNKDTQEAKAFNNINNEYFIPGSSIKGMLRSVMEIMSFGRMGNKVNDHKYSVRDFQNPDIYNMSEISNSVECGWLKKDGDNYFVQECGRPGRISHKEIDERFKTKMCPFFSAKENLKEKIEINRERIGAKSAHFKYLKFSQVQRKQKFNFSEDKYKRTICNFSEDGKPGTIVFTGQPGERYFDKRKDKWEGKHLEFVFFEASSDFKILDFNVIDNFLFAYYEHDKSQQKEDWKYWKTQWREGKNIPVFFRKENGKIIDMGLSMLYKITYESSIKDAINHQQKNANFYDLAETIFGYTEDKDALKGRVHVGHAFAKNNPTALSEVNAVLAGPKASYYPNYIEQNPKENGRTNEYKTFMDGNSKIRGWKRYPIHSGGVKKNLPPEIKGRVNDKIGTQFIPLSAGMDFSLDINYHNLRKEELGALISVITFHNTEGLYHSIGSGKPLGYGKSSILITNLEEDKKIEMLKAFEMYMDFELEHSSPLWFQCDEIKELFAMAKPGSDDSKLEYMKMKKKKSPEDPMDFVTAKLNKLALQKYSFISKNKVSVNSLCSQDELQKAKKDYQNEKEIFETQRDITALKNNLISKHKQELETALDFKKKELIEKLTQKREEILEQEIKEKEEIKGKMHEENRDNKQAVALQKGLNLEGFNITDRKALDNLGKLIISYAKDLHLKSENQLKTDIAEGELIQSKDHEEVTEIIKGIFAKLKSKKDKEKWLEIPLEKNHAFLKFKFWLGQSEAQSLYNQLNNLP